jgi:hypothetical protein
MIIAVMEFRICGKKEEDMVIDQNLKRAKDYPNNLMEFISISTIRNEHVVMYYY